MRQNNDDDDMKQKFIFRATPSESLRIRRVAIIMALVGQVEFTIRLLVIPVSRLKLQ
jgi:hypothetical protein